MTQTEESDKGSRLNQNQKKALKIGGIFIGFILLGWLLVYLLRPDTKPEFDQIQGTYVLEKKRPVQAAGCGMTIANFGKKFTISDNILRTRALALLKDYEIVSTGKNTYSIEGIGELGSNISISCTFKDDKLIFHCKRLDIVYVKRY
jgi:hypothetical protein